ncbi:MAG: Hsp20/alpha crystallin family protein [bacterium]
MLRRLGVAEFARWPRLFGANTEATAEWAPAADISESEKEYTVKAELPGVKREDVKVTQEDGVLTIEGERKYVEDDKTEKTHRVERFYGSFVRRFSLPDDADADGIRAESKDGVLHVRIPKLKVAKPKAVQIKVE